METGIKGKKETAVSLQAMSTKAMIFKNIITPTTSAQSKTTATAIARSRNEKYILFRNFCIQINPKIKFIIYIIA